MEELENQLAEKDQLLEETQSRLLRALADFDNLKKRNASEREEMVRIANEALMAALLPIIDNFARALASAEEHQINEDVLKGIALIKKQFEDALQMSGVEEVDSLGKDFDPNFHEAVMAKDSDGPDHKVIEVVQKGYTLFGKLLRPTMVIVSKK